MEKMLINGIEKRFTEKRAAAAAHAMRVYCHALKTGGLPSELSAIYGRYSTRKAYAMQACKNDARGPVFITGHNGFRFSVLYVSADGRYVVTDTGITENRYPLSWLSNNDRVDIIAELLK